MYFNVLLIINVREINSYRQEYHLPYGFGAIIRGRGMGRGYVGRGSNLSLSITFITKTNKHVLIVPTNFSPH